MWVTTLQYGKTSCDFPQDPPKPQNTVSSNLFSFWAIKACGKTHPAESRGSSKYVCQHFAGRGGALCGVVQHPCDWDLWQTPQNGTQSWHVRVSHFAVRHWHGPLKRQPFILQSTHHSEIMLVVRLHVANVQSVCLETTKGVQVHRQLKETVFTCCMRWPWSSSCHF